LGTYITHHSVLVGLSKSFDLVVASYVSLVHDVRYFIGILIVYQCGHIVIVGNIFNIFWYVMLWNVMIYQLKLNMC